MFNVGLMLACFMTRKCPLFRCEGNEQALWEMTRAYGLNAMDGAAAALGIRFRWHDINLKKLRGFGMLSGYVAYYCRKKSLPVPPKQSLEFLDCLTKLNPRERYTADQALEHPFLQRQ